MSGEGLMDWRRSAADAGKQLRAMLDNPNRGDTDAADLFALLCGSEAVTALDALACASVARMLLKNIEPNPYDDQTIEQSFLALRLVSELFSKTIDALEEVTGDKASTFVGYSQ